MPALLISRSAHVGAVEHHVDAVRLGDLGAQQRDLVGVAEAIEHDVGAARGEQTCNAQADARRGPGDQGGLAFEHVFSSAACLAHA
jgi:hypothetical protein